MKTRKLVVWMGVLSLVLVLLAGLAGACNDGAAEPAATEEPATTGKPATTEEPAAAEEPGEEVEAITLRLAIATFPEEPLTYAINDFAASFNEHAQGKAEIVVYGGASLGDDPQYLEMVRTGAVDLAVEQLGHMVTDAPIFGFADLPFLLDNEAARDAAITPMAEAVFNRVFMEQFNQKPITWTPINFLDMGSVKEPVKTLEDLEGKIISCNAGMEFKIITALGGSPMQVSGPEVFGALEKNVVDAILMPVDAAFAMNLAEVMPYWTVSQVHTAYSVLNMNLDVFNGLPEDIQALIVEEGAKCQQDGTARIVESYGFMSGMLQEAGMEFYTLPTEERERWKEVCLPIWDEFIAEIGPDAETLVQICQEANAANQ